MFTLTRQLASIAALSALAGCATAPPSKPQAVATALPNIYLDAPSELTTWPWPSAKTDAPHRGVQHWNATARDKTSVDLLEFDFQKNPALRFELYSQDQDDAKPFDNVVKFWPLGVGQATRHLNAQLQKSNGGQIIAAWNGPFFGYYRSAPIPEETAFHLAPITLRGKVHFNTRNHRWSMGVKMVNGQPVFKTFHLPGRALLEREFDFSSGTLQCLLKNGQPLKIEPFPRGPNDFKKQPVPSTPQEAGHVPYFDHAKFSRASLGWSHDSSRLYLLLVREPNGNSEGQSIGDLQQWKTQNGGWNVLDLQRFWLSMHKAGKVSDAINSDAGDVAQLCFLLPANNYQLISPIGDWPKFERKVFTPDFAGAPQGGSLMYFTVRDSSVR